MRAGRLCIHAVTIVFVAMTSSYVACRDPNVTVSSSSRERGEPIRSENMSDGCALDAGNTPSMQRNVLAVTQVLNDSSRGTVLLEEVVSNKCDRSEFGWKKWCQCVAKSHDRYKWWNQSTFRLVERRLNDGHVQNVVRISNEMRFLLLDYWKNQYVDVDTIRRFIRYHMIGTEKPIQEIAIAQDEVIYSAKMVASQRLVLSGTRGRSAMKGFVRLYDIGKNFRMLSEIVLDYDGLMFSRPNWEKSDDVHEALYDECQGGIEYQCERVVKEFGLKYSRNLKRDRFARLDASRDGSMIAAVVFGNLYTILVASDELKIARRWSDAFYESADWFMEDPDVHIGPNNEYIALSSTRRLVRLVNTKSGQVLSFRERASPVGYPQVSSCRPRGVAFESGSRSVLLIGQRPGNVIRHDFLSGVDSVVDISDKERLSPDLYASARRWTGYISSEPRHLLVWTEGIVKAMLRSTGQAVWSIGSPYFTEIEDMRLYSFIRNSRYCERDRTP
jgi:hypothetical protein